MSDEDSPTSHDIQIEDHRNSIKPAVKIVVSTKVILTKLLLLILMLILLLILG